MNVLVIGGAGYIGSHCVRQLALAGHKPVVLDNLVFGHRAAVASGIAFYDGDLGNEPFVVNILRKEQIEAVIHFAAYAYVGESVDNPLKYYENNFGKVICLLRAMNTAGVKKFVFSSTCATYGVPERLPITEGLNQQPINPYGQTKLDVENMLKNCARAYGLSFAAFRYFNAAGAAEDGSIGEDHNPETHLIPLAIGAAQGIHPALKVFGTDYPTPDGTCLRDYIHVDDLSRAHFAVFPLLETPGTQCFYNLGVGKPYSVLEVINTVEAVTGLKVPFSLAPRRAGDPPSLYADSSKAQREIGWKIKHTDLRSIIETAWKWHQARPKGFGS
ncbi:MAG: UDP-glucose 4-epimerase GalE [Verrucomicrobiota bacterium]|nr:UDP-glucose 4-epimerase GalE [Verrucomicrobiota bacterium]